MSDEGERAWAQAVAFTRDRSPASFDQWFSGVQYDGFTDGVLCLRARDEFVRQWVGDYFLPTIGERLRERSGLSIQVRWSIDGWKTSQNTNTLDTGLGIHAADLPTNKLAGGQEILFTFYWQQVQRWEGTNFSVLVEN